MSDAQGTAKLKVEVSGAEEATTKFEEIKAAAKKAGTALEDANNKSSASIDRHIKRLEDQKNKVILTTREFDLYTQQQKGATQAQLDSIKSIHNQIEAYKKLNPEIVQSGLSAKEQAWALRGVPAQFTDIVTSLQGGQKPLTVFLQQGGQLKDMFGGSGNAAKALGGYVLGLINPFTLGAAAVATLGIAAYQGAKEQEIFAKALIMTGNAAGVTIGQLSGMAKTISDTSSFTQGAAAEALAAFAADGNAPRDKLSSYAKVALGLEREMGISVADTVKQFAELGKDPVGASIKLNETTRHLTESVYLQIRALAEQGKTVEAGRLAMQAWADVADSRIPEMAANLGTLEKAWRGLADGAKWAWDKMLDAGREDSLDQKIEKLKRKLAAGGIDGYKNMGKTAAQAEAEFGPELKMLEATKQAKDGQAIQDSEAQKKLKARIEYDALHNENLSKEEQLQQKIKKIRETGFLAGMPQKTIDADVAAATRKSRGPGFDDAIIKAQQAQDLAGIKAGLNAEVLEYTNADKLLTAAHSLRLIDDKTFFDEKLKLIRATGDAEVRGLQAEIDTAKKAKFTGDNRVQQTIENQTKINDLQAKIDASRAITTAAINQNAFEVAAANKKIQRSYEDAAAAAKNYLAQVQRQYGREVAGVGKGDEFRQNQAALGGIEDRKIGKIDALNDQKRNNTITQAEYDDKVALAKKSYDDEVAAFIKSRIDLKVAQGDWTNGYSDALADMVTQSQNVAGNIKGIFTTAFSGISSGIGDSFAQSLLHGKSLERGLIGVADKVATQFISSYISMEVASIMSGQKTLAFKLFESMTGSGAAIAAKDVETTAVVTMNAAQAASGAAASQAAIPIIGPGLAFAAGATMMAFVMAMLNKGGGGGGGGDSTTTVVNRNPYKTTTAVPLAGARALGGPVKAGSLYEVNERGPEIITTGNRDYLMMGAKGGFVTPNGGKRGGDMSSLASEALPAVEIKVHAMPGAFAKDFFMIHRVELGKAIASGRGDNMDGFKFK